VVLPVRKLFPEYPCRSERGRVHPSSAPGVAPKVSWLFSRGPRSLRCSPWRPSISGMRSVERPRKSAQLSSFGQGAS
jgi:hypothetical protein